MHRDEWRDKKPGEFLAAKEINMLARRHVSTHNDSLSSLPRFIEVETDVDIPAFSVFGIHTANDVKDAPMRARVKKIAGVGNPGSPFAVFTNDSIPIPADTIGHARAVGFWETFKVVGSGTPGMPCGAFDSFGVSAENRYGFTCVGLAGVGHVWIIRGAEPFAVVGRTIGGVSAASDDQLGTGIIRVKYRVGSNLINGQKPGPGGSWLLDVYNICEFAIEDGINVKAEICVGIGPVVDIPCSPPGSSVQASASSVSHSSASSSLSRSSSSLGSVTPSQPSSASSEAPPSSQGSQACVDTISGVNLADIPEGTPAWALGIDSNGCLIKFPVGSCEESSGS